MGGEEDIIAKAATPVGSTPGLFVAPSVEELNEALPAFEVLELLGQGGMGAVYKARQKSLDRLVAIKLLPAFVSDEHNFAERFEREARAMARLNHPNIVTVHDFGVTEAGHRYIVMEFVDGADLHSLIQTGKVGVKRAMEWFPQICSALQYAHEHDVVHRDIKPANMLITSKGDLKIGDFGLAKLIGRKHETSITRTRVSMGTPDYAAPEALEEGGVVDHRADIYSLGVLFYEMLTSKVPRGAWQPPSAFVESDARLDRVIIKAMQPEADQRYQSVDQMSASIEEIRKSPAKVLAARPNLVMKPGPSKAAPTPAGNKASKTGKAGSQGGARRRKRDTIHPLLVAGIAIGCVLLAVGLSVYVMTGGTLDALFNPGAPTIPEVTPVLPAPAPVNSQSTTPTPELAGSKPVTFAVRSTVPAPSDGWVNLLPYIDLDAQRIRGEWNQFPDGSLGIAAKRPDAPARLLFPVPAALSYEAEFESESIGQTPPMSILLPAGRKHVLLALVAGREVGEYVLGLSQVNGHQAAKGDNPARRHLSAPLAKTNHFHIRVVTAGDKISILVRLNEEEVIRWAGDQKDVEIGPEWSRGPRASNASIPQHILALESEGTVVVRKARIQSLEKTVALDSAPPRPKPKPAPAPPSVPDDASLAMAKTPKATPDPTLEEAERKLAALNQATDARILSESETVYLAKLDGLSEPYLAKLNLYLEGANRELNHPLKAAAEQEIARVRAKQPIEDTDPEGLPELIKMARRVFRLQVQRFEFERNQLTIPILTQKAEALNALRAEFAALNSKSSLVLIDTALSENATRLNALAKTQESLTAILTAASTPAALTPTPAAAPPVLVRATFPPERSRVRGAVISIPRNASSLPDSPLAQIPSGLSSTVAISGSRDAFAALKSSGKVVVWGLPTSSASFVTETESLSQITRLAFSRSARDMQLIAQDEKGALNLVTGGWTDTRAETLAQIVEFAAAPSNGLAINAAGKVFEWGDISVTPPVVEKAVKLSMGPGISLAIQEDGTVVSWGENRADFPPIPTAREVVFGTHPDVAGVALLLDGKVSAFGTFAEFQGACAEAAVSDPIERLVGGFDAFAVKLKSGKWRFFGANLDAPVVEAAAAGCLDVVIGRDWIIGLQEN